MGAGQQKPTINAKQGSSNSSSNDDKFLLFIRQKLRSYSTNGYLNKDSFNQMLAVLENLGFKRLRDSPLADRLYVLFDKTRSGSVSEEQFSKGITELINDKNAALVYTFRAYDVDGDNKISRRQFMYMIEQSWRVAFRLLAEKSQGGKLQGITLRDIDNWATSKLQLLNEKSGHLFSRMDSNQKGYVEYQEFKNYLTNSGYNEIEATIGSERVVVPLNLTTLYSK